VMSQAGAFTYPSREFSVVDLVRHRQANDLQIWMDVGSLDFLLEDNRQMKNLLAEQKYNVNYRECSGAHNYTSWCSDVWRGLEKLFPPN